ncbi:hypothetical protein D1O30_14725 [Methylocystis hirsuta]|uniref:Uncharacterized protein n=1 Tax=Methylocystis hirsuta TaxID=369798 RepID=A0A3M9XQU8_9HYPH|nr:hypothetical protein D1O30_14725 [Methylocystis hirsuta]
MEAGWLYAPSLSLPRCAGERTLAIGARAMRMKRRIYSLSRFSGGGLGRGQVTLRLFLQPRFEFLAIVGIERRFPAPRATSPHGNS